VLAHLLRWWGRRETVLHAQTVAELDDFFRWVARAALLLIYYMLLLLLWLLLLLLPTLPALSA